MLTDIRALVRSFTPATRARLLAALLGSILQAFLEIAAVGATLPLMQVLTGATPTLGPFGPAREALGTTDPSRIAVILAAIIFLCFMLKGLFTIAFRWWVLGFIARQQVATSTELFRYYLNAPFRLFQTRSTGEFMRYIGTSVSATYSGVVVGLVSVVTEAVTVIAILSSLLVLMPVPALVMIGYFGSVGTVLYLVTRGRAVRAGQDALEASEELFSAAAEPIAAIKDIRIRDNAEGFVRRFERVQSKAANAGRVSSYVGELPKYVLEMVFILGVALMTALIFTGQPSAQAVSMLALFAVAGFRVLPSTTRLVASLNSVRVGRTGLSEVLRETSAASSLALEDRQPAEPLPFRDSVRFDAVRYRYPTGSDDVLRGLDLTIPRGRSVALVGGSGAGKSTIADLVLGLTEPTAGRILVDGTDIATNLRGWRRNVAMVPQMVQGLNGTIAENVLFGDPRTPENLERVRRAAAQAQLDDVLAASADGLDMQVGEWASRLSGGQRQRLGIARALYREPSLLVLDEATSALDNVTEHRLTQVIHELQGETTLLVIAHRLSTIRHCDEIVLLRDGRVAARGTFDELVDTSPDFAELARLGSLRN